MLYFICYILYFIFYILYFIFYILYFIFYILYVYFIFIFYILKTTTKLTTTNVVHCAVPGLGRHKAIKPPPRLKQEQFRK